MGATRRRHPSSRGQPPLLFWAGHLWGPGSHAPLLSFLLARGRLATLWGPLLTPPLPTLGPPLWATLSGPATPRPGHPHSAGCFSFGAGHTLGPGQPRPTRPPLGHPSGAQATLLLGEVVHLLRDVVYQWDVGVVRWREEVLLCVDKLLFGGVDGYVAWVFVPWLILGEWWLGRVGWEDREEARQFIEGWAG
ncbi:hypothetical protein Tco_0344116 [Tanacetum coccineum]